MSWSQARGATSAGWDRVDSRLNDSPDNYSADVAPGDEMNSDKLINTLNDLLESIHDGEFGYRECAGHIKA